MRFQARWLLFCVGFALLQWPVDTVQAQQIPEPTVSRLTALDSLQPPKDTGLWVRKRVRSTKRGAMIGAIAGATFGTVMGIYGASQMQTLFGGRRDTAGAIGVGCLVGAAGALSWGAIGAGIGTFVWHDELKRVKVSGGTVAISF